MKLVAKLSSESCMPAYKSSRIILACLFLYIYATSLNYLPISAILWYVIIVWFSFLNTVNLNILIDKYVNFSSLLWLPLFSFGMIMTWGYVLVCVSVCVCACVCVYKRVKWSFIYLAHFFLVHAYFFLRIFKALHILRNMY